MRLGVIVLCFAIAVAMACPPAIAQSSEVPAAEKAAEKAAKKAEKEAEKAAKKAEKAAEKAAKEAEKAAKKAEEAEKAAKKPGKEKDDPGGAGGGGGDDEEGEEGGGDTGSEGQASGRGQSSTTGQGSPGEGSQSPFVGERGCGQTCNASNARTPGDDKVGDLAATGGPGGLDRDAISLAAVEDEGQFQEGRFALGPATTADGNPGAFALLTLAAMVLLVGLVGGLRAALPSADDA